VQWQKRPAVKRARKSTTKMNVKTRVAGRAARDTRLAYVITQDELLLGLAVRFNCIFVTDTDSVCLASASMTWLALKPTVFSEKTSQNGHNAVQGHSRSPILVLFESLYASSY